MKTIRLFATALLAASASFAQATTSASLDVYMHTGRTVQASIGGKPGTFLLDTGGGVTNISPEFAAAIGCKPWGQISGYTMMGRRLDMKRCDSLTLRFGNKTIPLETVGVFDGKGMMPPNAPHLDGTLALDAFAGRALALSFTSNTLTLLDRTALSRKVKNRSALRLHMVRDAEGLALSVNLPVSTAQGTAWFELDSGNTSPFLLVGNHLAGSFSLCASTQDTQELKAALADGTDVHGDAKVMDLALDGNLGTTFLARHDVVLDLAHARAWLLPAS